MFPSYTNNGQRKEQSQTWNTSSWKSNQIKCFENHFLAKRNTLLKLKTPLIAANTPTITRKDSIKANLAMIKISVTNKNYIIITPPVTPSHNISLDQETNESTPITIYHKNDIPILITKAIPSNNNIYNIRKAKNRRVKMAVSLDVQYVNPYIIGHQTTQTIKVKIICTDIKYYYKKHYDHPSTFLSLINESRNSTVLDSGASKTVWGDLWFNNFQSGVSNDEKISSLHKKYLIKLWKCCRGHNTNFRNHTYHYWYNKNQDKRRHSTK